MLLKEMFRTTAGLRSGSATAGCVSAGPLVERRCAGPMLMLIGPVTSLNTRFENEMFSNREPGLPCILIGQPYTWYIRQFDTLMFSATPPPKRKTDQRVMNAQLVIVKNLQLPNSAHA